MDAPKPVAKPDFSNLIDCVVKGHEAGISEGYEDEDFSHYVYEEAMKAIFGQDYFTWRNKQKW